MNIDIGTPCGAYIEIDRGEVARRARQLWDAAGRPAERERGCWLQALVELLAARQHRRLNAQPSRTTRRRHSPRCANSAKLETRKRDLLFLADSSGAGRTHPRPRRDLRLIHSHSANGR